LGRNEANLRALEPTSGGNGELRPDGSIHHRPSARTVVSPARLCSPLAVGEGALSKEDAARLDEELARLSPEQQKAIEDTTPTDFIRRAAEDQQLMNIVAREDPQLAEKVRRFVAEFQADARTVAAAKGFDPEAADMGAALIVVTETLRPQSSQHTTTDHEVRSPPLEREPPISFRGGTS
jgi:hypothetical protein